MKVNTFIQETKGLIGHNTEIFICFMSKSYHNGKDFKEVIKDSSWIRASITCGDIILDPIENDSNDSSSLVDIRGLSFDVDPTARLVYEDEDYQSYQELKSYRIGKYYQYDAIVFYCGD